MVGGYSDGGQVTLELAARHPGAASALIIGAAYPDFASTGLRELSMAFLGVDEAGVPASGATQWRALVHQTAPMWLDYQGLTADEIHGIQAPALVFAGDRDEQEGRLDLADSSSPPHLRAGRRPRCSRCVPELQACGFP